MSEAGSRVPKKPRIGADGEDEIPRTRSATPLAAGSTAVAAVASNEPAPPRTPRFHFDVPPLTSTQFEIPEAYRADFRELRKGLPWFPANACDIDVIADSALFEDGRSSAEMCRLESDLPGYKDKILVSIGIDAAHSAFDPKSAEGVEAIPEPLYNLASMTAAYALGKAKEMSLGSEPIPRSVENMKKFRPPHQGNGFHQAVKSMAHYVRPELKTPWLQHYAADIAEACGNDYSGVRGEADPDTEMVRHDDGVYDRGMAWMATVEANALQPEAEFWNYPATSRPRSGSESSGREDDPSVPEGTDPMKLTRLDRYEIRQYEAAMAERRPDEAEG